MTEFGSDIAGVEDVDALLSVVSSESGKSLSENVARRFLQPRGSLFYDPEYGLDVRMLIADHMPKAVAETAIANEAQKDPRVFLPTCTITENVPSGPAEPLTWKIALAFQNELGKVYDLVFAANESSLELLEGTT